MSNYKPEYISQVMSYVSGDVVTADELNTILNKLIHQGDNNSAWLQYLETQGIPAAVAELTTGDVETFIENTVTSQIAALTAGAASKTNGFKKKARVGLINLNPQYSSTGWANCKQMNATGVSAITDDHIISTGYSGSDIINMTSAYRASDCANGRAALATGGSYIVYQSKLLDAPVDISYLKDNVSYYLYKDSDLTATDYWAFTTCKPKAQYPVYEASSLEEFKTAVDAEAVDPNKFIIIAYSVDDSTDRAEAMDYLTSKGVDGVAADTFIFDFEGVVNGTTPEVYVDIHRYGTYDSTDNLVHYDQPWLFLKHSGTGAQVTKFSPADIMLLSKDKLTFTQEDNTFTVASADGTGTNFTYIPTTPTPDDTKVGITALTSDTYPVVCGSTSGTEGATGSSKTNNTITMGNKYIKAGSYKCALIKSYSDGTLELVDTGV